MALAERHPPVGIARDMPRLGAGAMPAGAVTRVVGVLDLEDLQRRARGVGLAQVDHKMGVHAALGIPRRERRTAAHAVHGVMRDDVIDGQSLQASMAGCAGALSGSAPLARVAGGLALRWLCCGGLIARRRRGGIPLGMAIARVRGRVIRRRRRGLVAVVAGPLPRRHAARRTRAVVRVAVQPRMRQLEVREQLHR